MVGEPFANEFPAIQEQLRRITNDDPDILAVRKEAADLLDAGNLDGAKALLARARARISELRQQRSRDEAALLVDEARIDRLQLNYRPGASKFAEAGALVAFDAELAFRYLTEQGKLRTDIRRLVQLSRDARLRDCASTLTAS